MKGEEAQVMKNVERDQGWAVQGLVPPTEGQYCKVQNHAGKNLFSCGEIYIFERSCQSKNGNEIE